MIRERASKMNLEGWPDNRAKDPAFRAAIGDKMDISRLADRFGLSSERVRDELSKRGWHREESAHGLIFWYPRGHKT